MGATLRHGTQASHCGGFSCCRARALGTWTSAVVARGLSSCGSQALEHRLSSCGAQAHLLHGMWDLPGPGLKPVSCALAGGFLTTVPPGKPLFQLLYTPLLNFYVVIKENSGNAMKSTDKKVQMTFISLYEENQCSFCLSQPLPPSFPTLPPSLSHFLLCLCLALFPHFIV